MCECVCVRVCVGACVRVRVFVCVCCVDNAEERETQRKSFILVRTGFTKDASTESNIAND